MATPQSGRRSRKRRKPGAPPRAPTPPNADSFEPGPRSAREALSPRPRTRRGQTRGPQLAAPPARPRDNMLGTYGEPPKNPYGGVPVSEIVILAGAVGAIFGLVTSRGLVLAVGVVLCTLGVAEFSAREHFSGYRSHTTMLAAIPAIGAGIVMIALVGGTLSRGPLLVVVVLVFILCFWLLRKRFRAARQARIAKPPAA